LVMVLQAGMPSAFATLVLSETYNLDRELAVTCVGVSSVLLLLTLPIWLWGFSTW
jgi:predicted permease